MGAFIEHFEDLSKATQVEGMEEILEMVQPVVTEDMNKVLTDAVSTGEIREAAF